MLIVLVLIASSIGCTAPSGGPAVVEGVIDLSEWSFDESGSVTLEGDWMVCWGQLLEPGTLDCPAGGWQTARVPGLWSEEALGSPFGGRGVATYRLRLLLPAGQERFGLHAGAPMLASWLWIDGVSQGGTGVVGSTSETTSEQPRRNRHHEFVADAEVEFWVHVANFEFRGGGFRRPWVIGRPEAIRTMAGRMLLRETVLFGVGVLVGLAYLVQFAVRPAERARGYFGMFTLVLGLRAIPSSIAGFSALLFPRVPFDVFLRFEYVGLALLVFSGSGYLLYKVPGVLPPRTIRAVQTIALALVPITLLAPTDLVLETLVFYFVLPPLVFAIAIVSYGRAWYRGVPGVASTVIASILYLIVIAHDLLRTYQAGLGLLPIELFPYFIVLWILAEANEGMQVFNRTFARVQSLSDELADANFELQETEAAVVRFVPFGLLRLLGKDSIGEIESGDHMQREMSVLYCEPHGFARLVEQMTTKAAFGALNGLVARMEPLIYHHDGLISQHSGHGVLALFPGAPQDALDAAIEISKAVDAFNREGTASTPPRPAFEVGIGISTGQVLVGTIGGDQHFSSSVIGDAVSQAPQVERLTRSTGARLLITATTRDGLADPSVYSFREVGSVVAHLEGSTNREAVAVFEVTSAEFEDAAAVFEDGEG